MKPVAINAFDILGSMAAASTIAFGAACAYKAAGTVQATIDIAVSQNLIGIADDDNVEKTEPGFYSQYDAVPLITAGKFRAWVTPNEVSAEDIVAGDYLEIADLGGTNALPVGVFQEMGAESGTGTGGVREATSVARALEDMDLLNIEPIGSALAVGDTTVTMDAAKMTSLDLSEGDYVLLEDHSGNCMINKVATVASTSFTVQIASTVAMASTTDDDVHKLAQVEAILI